MMNRILTAAIFLVSVCPAMAQTNPRINVFAAGSFMAATREFLMNSNNAIRTEYAKGGKIGFRFAAALKENWAGEATYSYGSNNFRAINLNPPRREREFETRVHQFLLNGSYYIPADEKWRPFATFGIGLYRFSPTEDGK